MFTWLFFTRPVIFYLNLRLILVFAGSKFGEKAVRLNLFSGPIEGHLHRTTTNRKAYVFLGIPYAEPPTGQLRFRATRPKKPWRSTNGPPLDCHRFKPSCPQNINPYENVIQSEDCLYINVFVGEGCLPIDRKLNQGNDTKAKSNGRSLCSVLYFVHGGANEFGGPASYPVENYVENFASHDIVMFSVAYRLGVLGFWSTGTKEAGGNWALHDIVEGARWIRKEAANFGGDKNAITIMGHSSSASSILLLTMTPMAKNLFHGTIAMSAIGDNGLQIINNTAQYEFLSQKVGCRNVSNGATVPRNIVECMRLVPANILINEYNAIRNYKYIPTATFSLPNNTTLPTNGKFNGILPEVTWSEMIYNRHPMPLLIGTTKNEHGFLKLVMRNATEDTMYYQCRKLISKSIYSKKSLLTRICTEYYTAKGKNVLRTRLHGKTELFSVWTEAAVKAQEDFDYFSLSFAHAWTMTRVGGQVYVYSYDYEVDGLPGVSSWHAQDLAFLLGGRSALPMTRRNRAMAQQYRSFLLNFIKFGNPISPQCAHSDQWKMFRINDSNSISVFDYMSIDLPSNMNSGYHADASYFWNIVVPGIELHDDRPSNKFGDQIGKDTKIRSLFHSRSTSLLTYCILSGFAVFSCAFAYFLFVMHRLFKVIERRFEYERIRD